MRHAWHGTLLQPIGGGHVCVAQHVYTIAMQTKPLKGNPHANTALVPSDHSDGTICQVKAL